MAFAVFSLADLDYAIRVAGQDPVPVVDIKGVVLSDAPRMVTRVVALERHYGWQIERQPRLRAVGVLFRELYAVHRVAIPRLRADPTSSINTANLRRRADVIEAWALKAGGSVQEPATAFANHLRVVAHHIYAGDPDAAWITAALNELQVEFDALAYTVVDFTQGPPGM